MLSITNTIVNRRVAGRADDGAQGDLPPHSPSPRSGSLANWSIPGEIRGIREFHKACGLSGCESRKQTQPDRRLDLEPKDACEPCTTAGSKGCGSITKHHCLVSFNNAIEQPGLVNKKTGVANFFG